MWLSDFFLDLLFFSQHLLLFCGCNIFSHLPKDDNIKTGLKAFFYILYFPDCFYFLVFLFLFWTLSLVAFFRCLLTIGCWLMIHGEEIKMYLEALNMWVEFIDLEHHCKVILMGLHWETTDVSKFAYLLFPVFHSYVQCICISVIYICTMYNVIYRCHIGASLCWNSLQFLLCWMFFIFVIMNVCRILSHFHCIYRIYCMFSFLYIF